MPVCRADILLVPDLVAYMDRREMKVPTLGKGWELNGLDPGGRTDVKQDPVNNKCPHYSPSSPEQVSPLH